MLSFSKTVKIYLSTTAIDMRKAIDGLSVAVADVLKEDPQSGHLFIFYNKQKNKVKILHWDRNGFLLIYKRLEKGRFKFSKSKTLNIIEIDHEQLKWLLAGFDFEKLYGFPELKIPHYY